MHHYLQYTGSQGNFFHSLPYLEPKATLQSRQLRNFRSWISAKFHILKRDQPWFAFAPTSKEPFSLHLPFEIPRATARICDRSISNPFSRHSGARVNNPTLIRIVHLLCHVPGGSHFWQQYVFIFLTQAKFCFVLGPRIGRRGSRERPTFFLYNPSSNPLGNCKQPLVVHFELILRPPLSSRSIAIYCALKCTLHHSGFGTADCNNFYDPRTSLDVTPTPPRGPLYTHTHRGGGGGGGGGGEEGGGGGGAQVQI